MASAVVMIWPGVSKKRAWMVSGGCLGVARKTGAQRGQQRLGEHGEDDVWVDVHVDCRRQRVSAKGADELGEVLFDGHPPGVVADQRLEGQLTFVGDDDGGRGPPESGDDQLAHRSSVAGQAHGEVFIVALTRARDVSPRLAPHVSPLTPGPFS